MMAGTNNEKEKKKKNYYYYVSCTGQFTNNAVTQALNEVGWSSAGAEIIKVEGGREAVVYRIPYKIASGLVESRKCDSRYKFIIYIEEQGRKAIRPWFKQWKRVSTEAAEAKKQVEALKQNKKN